MHGLYHAPRLHEIEVIQRFTRTHFTIEEAEQSAEDSPASVV